MTTHRHLLSPVVECRIAAIVGGSRGLALGGKSDDRPPRLVFRPGRVDLWAPGDSDPARRHELALRAGAQAFDIRTIVRRMGHHAAVHLLPWPSDPGLLAVVQVGRPAPPTREDEELYGNLEAPSPWAVPVIDRPWWVVERISGAANAEGARMHGLGRLEQLRLRAKTNPGEVALVVSTWGDGSAPWIRLGMALERIRLTALGLGRTARLLDETVQEAACREMAGDWIPDLDCARAVLAISTRQLEDSAEEVNRDGGIHERRIHAGKTHSAGHRWVRTESVGGRGGPLTQAAAADRTHR